MRALTKSLIILSILLSFEVYSGFWNCFKFYIKPPVMLKGLSDHKLQIIKEINVLDEVEFIYRGQRFSGLVKNFDFEKLSLQNHVDKNFKLSKIKELKVISQSKRKIETGFNRSMRIKSFIRLKLKEQVYLKTIDLKNFQAMGADQQKSFNLELAHKLEEVVFQKFKTRKIGFHFNLNGGKAIDYVEAGGIKANRGADIGVQFGDRNAEVREQVYFFSTESMSIYEIINMNNMKSIFTKNDRMGDTVNIFDLDHAFFRRGIQEKGIEPGEIFYTFNERWMIKNKFGQIGVPYKTYLMPPLEIYNYKNIGFEKLSREEQNYLVLKQIEFYLTR